MVYALGGDIKEIAVPDNVPDKICDYIGDLIETDINDRTNWEKENLIEKMKRVRKKVFKRIQSENKSLPKMD